MERSTNERNIGFGLWAIVATLSPAVNAECPLDLPEQLLNDCITIEGSGSSFPHDDYAYEDEYAAWRAARVERIAPAAGGYATNEAATDRRKAAMQ